MSVCTGKNSFCYREDVTSGSMICNVLNINFLFIKFLCAISYDHVVLMDYVISDETCFVHFLMCYLEYACDNWSSFTSEEVMRAGYSTDQAGISFSLSRKRKYSHQTEHVVCTSIQVDNNPSLVAYDLSDSSEESDLVDPSVLHKTMSCIIRLRLALERMLEKQIIVNSQSPAKLVSVIERLETLYERID